MTSINTLLLSLLVLVLSISYVPDLQAQQPSYACTFEDSTENTQWKLNVGTYGKDCKNKWFISTAGANEGANGLYISDDPNGETVDYINSGLTVVSYRELTLAAGSYTLSFDWQAIGVDKDALYVSWVPIGVNTNSVSGNSNLPPFIKDSALSFGNSPSLHLKSWNVASTNIISDGTPHKLVFAWNNNVTKGSPPSACVDNIFIEPFGDCVNAYDLALTQMANTIDFSWKGNADSYDIRCKAPSSSTWVYYNNITTNSVSVEGLEEGICYFYVRANCGNKFSPWTSKSKFVYQPNKRCIDYMGLSNDNCYYGTYSNPKTQKGLVDKGYSSIESRHTLHYINGERDSRTEGGLRTVPIGEIASVRLGNWDTENKAESVEYQYTVDASTSAIMLLKYAVVLENPNDHKEYQQAAFNLEILKWDGRPLGKFGCGEASFAAGYGSTTDWNIIIGEDEGDIVGTDVLWKDWTTIGINLQDYDGETLTIRMTSKDCDLGGHYGYAYFTLGCTDGKVQGLSCGDKPTTSFIAPEGFKYKWYRASDPTGSLSSEQEFNVEPDDTVTYKCNVIQPTNNNCFYTITASAMPRYPVSDGSYEKIMKDCSNEFSFNSSSYIILINQITRDTTISDQTVESVLWDFGDGIISTELNPTHTYPPEGGTFYVTLTSSIADNLCTDDTIFEVVVPDISIKESTTTEYVCKGEQFKWKDETYFTSCVIRNIVINPVTQCDSIVNINLIFIEKNDSVYADTVCTDEPYDFKGQFLTESGTYHDTLRNSYDCCDSILTLNLLVNKPLKIDFSKEITLCANDDAITIAYDLTEGIMASYDVLFDDPNMAKLDILAAIPNDSTFEIPITERITPNVYTAQLIMDNVGCDSIVENVVFTVLYPDTILAQRWNDVIGIRNVTHNGGYEFSSYQWYKDNDSILGATKPNLYVQGGLDLEAEYTIKVVRTTDNVELFVCPITLKDMSDTNDKPTSVVFSEQTIKVAAKSRGIVKVWSVSGILISASNIAAGESEVTAPKDTGIYLLEIISTDGNRETHKIVVK